MSETVTKRERIGRRLYCEACRDATMILRRDLDDAKTTCASCGTVGYGARWSIR